MNHTAHAVRWILPIGLILIITTSLPAKQPNIIFVLADDLGWSELGCYGNTFNETPHLDELARRGLRFEQAYASAPVCSPYRAALLTGLYPARIGITDYLRPNSANGLSTEFLPLAKALGDGGYTTGMIGKWHLTGYKHHGAKTEIRPRDHGFQWDTACEVKSVGNGANFWPYVFRDQSIRWLDLADNKLGDDEYLVDRMNAEAVEFIKRHSDNPFFLYLSHYAPHTILHGKPSLVEKYRQKHPPGRSTRQKCYLCEDRGLSGDPLHHWAGDHNPHLAAMLESIDEGVGQIVTTLKQLGIEDQTIMIFTSDNGGETNVTSNAPLRGGKSQLYEGGIRVPLIVKWPGTIPANEVCNVPTMNVDFFPTLLDAAGVSERAVKTVSRMVDDEPMDGRSMLNVWKRPNQGTSERTLFWHYPLDRPHFLGGHSAGAIRSGDWKLIEAYDTGDVELFHLQSDLSERNNLASEKPERVAALQKQLAVWRTRMGATIPSVPLLTDIGKLDFADHFSPGQVSSRWHFTKDWTTEVGVLHRKPTGSVNSRIFLKDAQVRDAVVRFNFRFGESKDVRLVTGSNGPYNTVIHIRADHFYIQTARDPSGPWFPYRHGECAFNFDPEKWYSMTVEFIGDEVVAHIDHEHVAYAKHPLIKKERTYFAFQVDESAAQIDDVQIFQAKKKSDAVRGRAVINRQSNRFPVQKSAEEELQIARMNAHEHLYQTDPAYRKLVHRVDELDEKNKRRFPNVFRTHKEIKKKVQEKRKLALKNDPVYKETLFATYRASRAMDAYLLEQEPQLAKLPANRQKFELERVRKAHTNDPDYQILVQNFESAEDKLQTDYAEFFITDDEINAFREKSRQRSKSDPEFQAAIKQRAEAYYEQQDYLIEHDERLAAAERRLKTSDTSGK